MIWIDVKIKICSCKRKKFHARMLAALMSPTWNKSKVWNLIELLISHQIQKEKYHFIFVISVCVFVIFLRSQIKFKHVQNFANEIRQIFGAWNWFDQVYRWFLLVVCVCVLCVNRTKTKSAWIFALLCQFFEAHTLQKKPPLVLRSVCNRQQKFWRWIFFFFFRMVFEHTTSNMSFEIYFGLVTCFRIFVLLFIVSLSPSLYLLFTGLSDTWQRVWGYQFELEYKYIVRSEQHIKCESNKQ